MIYRIIRQTDQPSKVALPFGSKKLRERIEYQFKEGMCWENYGKWEIDHIIPVIHFLKKGESRPHIINALSNLQPLWKEENRKKKVVS